MFVINLEKKIWDLTSHIFIFSSHWIKYIYLIDLLTIALYLKKFWAGINSIKLKLSNLTYHIFVSILTFAVWSCLYIRICMLSPLLFPRRSKLGERNQNDLEIFTCRDTIVHVHYAVFLLHAYEHVHASLCHRLIKAYHEMKSRWEGRHTFKYT